MNENNVVPGSLKAWILAARPKTLSGAAVPVMIGGALAYAAHGEVRWLPLALCFLFAFLMQIDANFVNDYFDCIKGTDTAGRLGPLRACSQGWISLPAMRTGILLTTLISCLAGLPLVIYGGMDMVLVGLACVVFCFLYTTCLSYWGLGDVLVLVFFGLVPVCATYWLVTSAGVAAQWPVVVWSAVACGLVVDALLVVNNYRDIDTDRLAGKHTLVVRLGRRTSELLYLGLGVVAFLGNVVVLGCFGRMVLPPALLLFYLAAHLSSYRRLRSIGRGRELNRVLGRTALGIFLYGVSLSLGLILSALLGHGIGQHVAF